MTTKYVVHKEKWKGCTACPLHEVRKSVVLCRGKLPAQILFIGEAPGPSEDIVGQPFMGPAGHLLDGILIDAGYTRLDVRYAFTNLVACIPKEDSTSAKFAEPPKESIAACAPRLLEFIKIARPKLIVQVGKLSEKWIPKMKLSIPTISITHPAAILRSDVARRPIDIHRCTVVLEDALNDLLEGKLNV